MTAFLVIGVVGLVLLGIFLVVGDLADGLLSMLPESDVFSSAVLFGFVSAFGFAGAIGRAAGLPAVAAVVIGVVAGVGFGWFASWLTRLVRDGGGDSSVSVADTVGQDATVVTPIPGEGFGVVQVSLRGHTLRLNARAHQPVDAGTPVYVSGVLSPTAVTVTLTHP